MRNQKHLLKRLCLFLVIVMAFSIILSSCESSENIMLKIGKNKVSFDEYRYFYMNYLKDLEASDDIVDINELYVGIEEILKKNYAVYDLADEYKVSLENDDRSYIEEQIEYAKATYTGDITYEDSLAENYLTEDVYRELLLLSQMKYKLYSALSNEYSGIIKSDDATVEADIYENFMHAKQIFIDKTNGKTEADNLSLANQISQKLRNGEDFDTLKAEYSDKTTTYDTNSDKAGEYYFTSGEMIKTFEDAVKSLEINEISDVVESSYGYHIIMRLPMEEEYIDKNFEDFRYTYTVRKFNEIIAERAEKLTIEYTDAFASIDQDTLINGKVSQ